MGCLVSYMTMKGPKKHRPERRFTLEQPLLSREEIAEIRHAYLEKKAKRRRRKKKFIKFVLNVTLLVGLIAMILICFALHYYFQWGRPSKTDVHHFWHVMFITFGKVIFVTSFMAILMPIAAKYKAFGAFIAKNRLLQLIGNISFGGYLYHFTIIMVRMKSQDTLPTYTFYDLFGAWCSDIFYTVFLATLSCLLVEFPIQNMWRAYIEKKLLVKLKNYVKGHPTAKEHKEPEEVKTSPKIEDIQPEPVSVPEEPEIPAEVETSESEKESKIENSEVENEEKA